MEVYPKKDELKVRLRWRPSAERTWLAEVTGKDERYVLRRKFIDPEKIELREECDPEEIGMAHYSIEYGRVYDYTEPPEVGKEMRYNTKIMFRSFFTARSIDAAQKVKVTYFSEQEVIEMMGGSEPIAVTSRATLSGTDVGHCELRIDPNAKEVLKKVPTLKKEQN